MEPIRSELTMSKIAGRTAAQAMVESDVPMPVGRDAERILYAQGNINSTACRCENGKILAEGELTLNMLCVGHDRAPFGMQASTQYSHDVHLSDVKEGMRAEVNPKLLDLRCSLREGRVHVEAVAELNSAAIDGNKTLMLSDVAGVSGLQKLYTETEIGEMRSLGAEQKRVHEIMPAPGVQQILLFNGKAQVSGCSITETEASVSSVLYINALYLDGDGQYMQLNRQIPFQETIQIDTDPRGMTGIFCEAAISDLFVSLGSDPGTLELDVSISFKLSGIANTRVQILADAYAPDDGLTCRRERAEQLSVVGTATRVCSYSEGMKIPDTLPEAFRAVFASARPTILGVTNDNGQLAVDGILITSAVYQTDDGSVIGCEEDIPFTCTLDAPYMPDTDVTANLLEAKASGGGRIINVSFTLEIKAVLRELVNITIATDIEKTEQKPRENGILIYYAGAGETYWDIGKRFLVTVPDIREWNPSVVEPFSEGQPIMIMSTAGRRR